MLINELNNLLFHSNKGLISTNLNQMNTEMHRLVLINATQGFFYVLNVLNQSNHANNHKDWGTLDIWYLLLSYFNWHRRKSSWKYRLNATSKLFPTYKKSAFLKSLVWAGQGLKFLHERWTLYHYTTEECQFLLYWLQRKNSLQLILILSWCLLPGYSNSVSSEWLYTWMVMAKCSECIVTIKFLLI